MAIRNCKAYSLIKTLVILFVIQGVRIILKQVFFLFMSKNIFNDDLINLLEMALFTILLLLVCKARHINLSIFPDTKAAKERYFIITLIVLFLIFIVPFINGSFSPDVFLSLAISTIATPIFEELIFRGYVWNTLKKCFTSELVVYIINTLLFAIWHLGYADSIYFRTGLRGETSGLPYIMLMKVVVGLCFGIVIGFVRYKFKNCHAAMLAHSIMNNFGR